MSRIDSLLKKAASFERFANNLERKYGLDDVFAQVGKGPKGGQGAKSGAGTRELVTEDFGNLKLLQQLINRYKTRKKSFPLIEEDGVLGDSTLNGIRYIINTENLSGSSNPKENLELVFNFLKNKYFLDRSSAEGRPNFELQIRYIVLKYLFNKYGIALQESNDPETTTEKTTDVYTPVVKMDPRINNIKLLQELINKYKIEKKKYPLLKVNGTADQVTMMACRDIIGTEQLSPILGLPISTDLSKITSTSPNY